MRHVSVKAVSLLKIPCHVPSYLRLGFDDGPALSAYQVEVVSMLRQVVGRGAVVDVAVIDQSCLRQRLEVAIHGRGGQRRLTIGRQRGPQLFGSGVALSF